MVSEPSQATDRDRSAGTSAASPHNKPKPKQRILLVTGMLGAGKTTVLNELEDLGWETIDNLPVRFLKRLIDPSPNRGSNPGLASDGPLPDSTAHPLAVGLDCRTRGFDPTRIIAQVEQLVQRGNYAVFTLFLDCADRELERRFDETRRRHHLAHDMPVSAGIGAERELLAPLRGWAGMLIDTTGFTLHDLKQAVRERFAGEAPCTMAVIVSSFGFARGMPPAADLVFDMRYLANPHWDASLRELNGQDPAVGAYIERDPAFASSYGRIRDLLLELLPLYAGQGKSYVNIALGCTGGKHRSVFVAERLAQDLRNSGFSPSVLHRNLGSSSGTMVENVQGR